VTAKGWGRLMAAELAKKITQDISKMALSFKTTSSHSGERD
jgi:hypothetical protein